MRMRLFGRVQTLQDNAAEELVAAERAGPSWVDSVAGVEWNSLLRQTLSSTRHFTRMYVHDAVEMNYHILI